MNVYNKINIWNNNDMRSETIFGDFSLSCCLNFIDALGLKQLKLIELIIFRSLWCSVSHHYVCLNVLNTDVLSLGLWPAAVLCCLRYFWLCSILADEISCLPTWLSWLVMPTERGVCFPPYDYSVLWVMYMFITFWPKLTPSRLYLYNGCITVYTWTVFITRAPTWKFSRAWS